MNYLPRPNEGAERAEIERLIEAEDAAGLLRKAESPCACLGPRPGQTKCPCELYGPPGHLVRQMVSMFLLRRGIVRRVKSS